MSTSTSNQVGHQQTIKPAEQTRTRKQPLYHVVLIDDDDHTYEYVVGMLKKVFAMTADDAFVMAYRVDTEKRVILDTTTLERAELKRDQIHTFGRDWRIPRCCGSMSAVIEPSPE